jgi:DNA-binding XRE family transcriptional regulator
MPRKRTASERVYRDLTPQEREQLEKARAETQADRDEILAEGRARKKAWEATRRELAKTIAALKAHREQTGLSLADVEARSGLKRSALSRLENDPNANPTLLTLHRYAAALGLTLQTTVRSA